MPASANPSKIDHLMNKASETLAHTRYFEAERMAVKALEMAHNDRDYERMARIVLPLQEARRQRYQQALDEGSIAIVNEDIADDFKLRPGCYLVEPPQVGADARRLRHLGLQREIPIAVLCCEPVTQLRQQPIVAINPGNSYRTKVDLPADYDNPDIEWFANAMEALGDSVIENLDAKQEITRRVDTLLEALNAIPEHERLHQVLEQSCRDAHHAMIEAAAEAARKKKR